MARFDPDYSIFCTLAGDITSGVPLENTIIDYANTACGRLYGDLQGKDISQIFSEIIGDRERTRILLERFKKKGQITFEGNLSGKTVKFHSRIIDCRDDDACAITQYIQAGITDISESVILKKLLYGTSEALKRAAEAADDDTGQHIARINVYSRLLAELYGAKKKFIDDISKFAQLHDIGKIKIAEIIRQPRLLTPDEVEEVKKHPEYGGTMVAGLDGLEMAHEIIMDHHERWDGTGYPSGKAGNEISLAGRIVAIADVFDALVSARPYKRAYSYDETRRIFEGGDGRVMSSHFDPQLLGLFFERYDSFVAIHKSLKE